MNRIQALAYMMIREQSIAVAQQLAKDNERFREFTSSSDSPIHCCIWAPMLHVTPNSKAGSEPDNRPFQVALHTNFGIGILVWTDITAALACRPRQRPFDVGAQFVAAERCDVATQAIIDAELPMLLTAVWEAIHIRKFTKEQE